MEHIKTAVVQALLAYDNPAMQLVLIQAQDCARLMERTQSRAFFNLYADGFDRSVDQLMEQGYVCAD